MELNIWEEMRDRLDLSALGKPAIIGLAALLAMVAVFAGKNIADTATASDFKIERAEAEEQAPSEQQEAQSIFVHVSGAVQAPGLVELPAGSRIADAVNNAGGFTDGAVTDSVNLARVLEDGEQVFVASVAEAADDAADDGANPQPAQAAAGAQGGKVNVNTASEGELESLPGIGPSTAAKIVADRQKNGSFASVEDLTRVSGIGEKKLAAIADMICV